MNDHVQEHYAKLNLEWNKRYYDTLIADKQTIIDIIDFADAVQKKPLARIDQELMNRSLIWRSKYISVFNYTLSICLIIHCVYILLYNVYISNYYIQIRNVQSVKFIDVIIYHFLHGVMVKMIW